jgi:hypothetical protein
MTVRKLKGSAIQSGTITTTQLSSSVSESISAGGGPKISSLSYPGDDLAANTAGGQTVQINGSGFAANSTVYLNGNAVASVTYNSSSNLIFTTPALSAATYPVYVINPEDGATAIFIPGLEISGEPTWNTAATLTAQDVDQSWNITLLATSDSSVTYALAEGSSLPSGISLAANGLISGTFSSPPAEDTTYNFTVIASDAENQDASRAFSVNVTTGEGVLFANTVLLLHGDGTNNQNNNVFLDSSNNNFTITRNGNPTQGSFSPFSQTGWSNYFDGTGDYLATPSDAAFNCGTDSFTLEFWFYDDGTSTLYPNIFSSTDWNTGVGGTSIRYNNQGAANKFYIAKFASNSTPNGGSGINELMRTANTYASRTWHHVAFVRNGNNFKIYVNGVSDAETTSTVAIDWNLNSAGAKIGGGNWDGANSNIKGYISNLRLVKGAALYTENFTPSTTPLQPIANTSLLTCQSNSIVDEGPNNFAITRNGDVSVQPYSPFAPGLTSANSHSVYFDGTGDYLTLSSNSALDITQGSFTIEAFVYRLPSSEQQNIIVQRPSSLTEGYGFRVDASTGYLIFYYTGQTAHSSSTTVPTNQWCHVVVARDGSNLSLYLDGSRIYTTSSASNGTTATSNVYIGGDQNLSDSYRWDGFISNVRLVKGTAVYDPTQSSITVPTSPLTNIANTSLLTCQSTTFVDNSDNNFTITANGNAVPKRFNPFGYTYTSSKYSTANVGGSGYFDGTGDGLRYPVNTSSEFSLGTSDFTVEAFVYLLQSKENNIGAQTQTNAQARNGFLVRIDSNNRLLIQASPSSGAIAFTVTSTATLSLNTWNHIAVVRSGNTFTGYLNGIPVVTTTSSVSITQDTSSGYGGWNVGYAPQSSTENLNGYISNFRLIKGTALYTSAFTPPSAPLTNVANTSLLCNFTNAGIFDSTAKNVLENVGDAKVSTAQYKYGTGSIYVPGTNDAVRMFGVNLLADFTIEGWAKPAIGGDDRFFIFQGINETNGFVIGLTTSQIKWRSNGQTDISAAINKSDWYHFAIVRSGSGTNNVKVYVDGSAVTQGTYTNQILASAGTLNIGPAGAINPAFASYGYIDDFRITKGYARYTSNFTPPAAALKDR